MLDANDNTPTFSNVSYNVNVFTDMAPAETVLQVHADAGSSWSINHILYYI